MLNYCFIVSKSHVAKHWSQNVRWRCFTQFLPCFSAYEIPLFSLGKWQFVSSRMSLFALVMGTTHRSLQDEFLDLKTSVDVWFLYRTQIHWHLHSVYSHSIYAFIIWSVNAMHLLLSLSVKILSTQCIYKLNEFLPSLFLQNKIAAAGVQTSQK